MHCLAVDAEGGLNTYAEVGHRYQIQIVACLLGATQQYGSSVSRLCDNPAAFSSTITSSQLSNAVYIRMREFERSSYKRTELKVILWRPWVLCLSGLRAAIVGIRRGGGGGLATSPGWTLRLHLHEL